jgi:hypothetical protein
MKRTDGWDAYYLRAYCLMARKHIARLSFLSHQPGATNNRPHLPKQRGMFSLGSSVHICSLGYSVGGFVLRVEFY